MRTTWVPRSIAVVLGLALAMAPVPLVAQDGVEQPDRADIGVYWELLEYLLDELAFAVILDGTIEPAPSLAQDMPGIQGIGPSPRAEYENAIVNLREIEAPWLVEELDSRGIEVSGSTWQVLQGTHSVPLDANVYLEAYDDVLWQWWYAGGQDYDLRAAPLGELREPVWWADDGAVPVLIPKPEVVPGEPPMLAGLLAADGVMADGMIVDDDGNVAPPPADEPAPIAEPPSSGDGTPLIETSSPAPVTAEPDPGSEGSVPVVAAGAALLALALLVLLWRRPRHGATPSAPPDQLLEAGRRFVAASSVDALGAQVAESAHRLSGGRGATFITADGSWTAGVGPRFPDDLVDQVRATGRTARRSDRALVAVLSSGRVVGLIGVDGPDADATVVEQLAPLAGEGLASLVDRDATEQLAFVDALTAVPNRRRFDRDLSHHSQLAAGEGVSVAVAMIDVDHFKTYNDQNGHQEGDEALRAVAHLIGQSLRAEDTVYRYGGEEFAVLLPGADVEAAHGVAERIRRAVESHDFQGGPGQPGGRVTVSIGVSTSPPPDGEVMLEAADAALYRAKRQGRNQVVLSGLT